MLLAVLRRPLAGLVSAELRAQAQAGAAHPRVVLRVKAVLAIDQTPIAYWVLRSPCQLCLPAYKRYMRRTHTTEVAVPRARPCTTTTTTTTTHQPPPSDPIPSLLGHVFPLSSHRLEFPGPAHRVLHFATILVGYPVWAW